MIDTSLPPEVAAARIGRLTASRLADATAKTRNGYGASRANYLAELIAERLTGVQAERYVSKEMLWGIEHESQAIAAYEFLHDASVEPVGFIEHPGIPGSGATPDGAVVDTKGLIEVKCPNTATHIAFLLSNEVDLRYQKQMLWQMACKGAEWTDFASFDPRMPPELQLRVRRFTRSHKTRDGGIPELEDEVRKFLAELDATEAALRTQMREAA